MSNQGSGSSSRPSTPISSAHPKAIGSLSKKKVDVTKQGTPKLKFAPTLPARRKKDADAEIKLEPTTAELTGSPRGRGRGRGRGDGRQPTEMTASGPFAMGPAMAGSAAGRRIPRSNFTPVVPSDRTGSTPSGLSQTGAPSLKNVKVKEPQGVKVDDDEVYSDPDDGVEIVDMEQVRQMDWMAPESLKRDKNEGRKTKVKNKFPVTKGKERETSEYMDVDDTAVEVDLANALDLSESEEEEELEDLIEDFALQAGEDDPDVRQERLYFFQFPAPFPTFVPKSPPAPSDPALISAAGDTPSVAGVSPKKVSFAADVKPPGPGSTSTTPSRHASAAPEASSASEGHDAKIDGVIGQLEIYKSGAVKMRLDNGILLDVTAGAQPSFLQHAVYLDMANKRLNVLGEVNKRFVVSPNVETLLSAMEAADPLGPKQEAVTSMDTS